MSNNLGEATMFKIKVIQKYKALTPFETPDLPSFVVLTGKNGSGKSQLLQLIRACLHLA